jgi:hypothetical protein
MRFSLGLLAVWNDPMNKFLQLKPSVPSFGHLLTIFAGSRQGHIVFYCLPAFENHSGSL